MVTPEIIADYACHTGEGPLWHADRNVLYWIDIPAGKLFEYHPDSGDHDIAYERNGPIGGFTIETDGRLLLFEEAGRIEAWDGSSTTVIRESLPNEDGSRFNDVIADPLGGVFAGTMPAGSSPGRLYRFDPDGSYAIIAEEVGVPNGLGFTPALDSLYFTESEAQRIYRYEYDGETGEVSNREVWQTFDENAGMPDGMTVDATGAVWIAFWNGDRLERRAPDGTVLDTVSFPARKVASVTLGGPTLQTAFVACAGGDEKESEGPGAGALFAFDAGVRGLPEFRSTLAD